MFDTGLAFEPWLAAVLAIAGLHLLVAWYARRAASRAAPAGAGVAADYVEDEEVTCPTCGAENELGYRFCRNCIGELPGANPGITAAGPSRSGVF